MKLNPLFCACVTALALAAPAQAAASGGSSAAATAEFVGFGAGFELQGTNGYSVGIGGFSERLDGKGKVYVGVARKGRYKSGAFYVAPALVSEDFFKADLGPFGRVDLALHPSGRTRKIHVRCSKQSYPFETGTYDGVVEFKGEQGYTRASSTRIPFQPPVTSFCGGASGKGESRGPGLPGARLQGLSFVHGRRLSFQVNKNHPRRGRVPFSFGLSERREGIQIHRSVEGFAPSSSFSFESDLSAAELSLPSPFSGSATLRRRANAVTPSWTGNLSVDFVGHPDVRLTGPGIYVSLAHACFSYSGDSSFAETC
jgi:hypothetical protein